MRIIYAALCVVILSVGIVSAQEYPEKVNNGEKFTTVEKFRGIYKKVHTDSHDEDLVTVCERTLRWPEFWKDEERIYSLRNCQNLRGKRTLTNFLNLENNNIKDFNSFKNNFTKRFESEKELLRLENDLRRTTSFGYIFSDGAEGSTNSPFDIISDLNEIGKILFGEKHERPELAFIIKSTEELNNNIIQESEIWLEQIEENLSPQNKAFDTTTNSFSGSLWRLGTEVLRENLNTYPLAASKVQKTAFDTPFANGIPYESGFGVDTHAIPAQSNDTPESISLSYNPLPKLNAYITDILLSQSTIATNSDNYSANRNIQLEKFLSIDDRNRASLLKGLNIFRRENSRESLRNNVNRARQNWTQMNQNLRFFADTLDELNTDIFPPFLEKPLFPY